MAPYYILIISHVNIMLNNVPMYRGNKVKFISQLKHVYVYMYVYIYIVLIIDV